MSEMKLHKYIGGKIKELRKARGMSQETLAEILGTTKQTISRWETGARGAGQDGLFQLACLFNVSLDFFFPARTPINK